MNSLLSSLLRVLCVFVVNLLFLTGCASVHYGPFKAATLGTDAAIDSATWLKKNADGSTEALTVSGAKKTGSESFHTLGNLIGLGLGLAAGGPAGAAAGFGGAEIWQTAKDIWLTPSTASVTPAPIPAATSATLNDDSACELVIKYQNRELPNDGRVTYLKRVLTSKPAVGANPVCVQYNDARSADGERTLWKEESNTAQKVDNLPTDIPINKVVVWYK